MAVYQSLAGSLPIITRGGRRNTEDGSPEVELSQATISPPSHLLQLRRLGLCHLHLAPERLRADYKRHVGDDKKVCRP
jgi:hypothetical protein